MLKIGLTGSIACGKSFIARLFALYGVRIIDSDLIAREVVLPNSPVLAELVAAFGPEVLTAHGALNRPYLRQMVFADKDKLALLNGIMHPAIRRRTEELCELARLGKPVPASYSAVCAQNRALHAMPRDCAAEAGDSGVIYGADGVILSDANTPEAAIALREPLEPALVLKPELGVAPPYIILDIPLLFENHLESMVDRILVVDAEPSTQVQRIMRRDHCSEENARHIMSRQVSHEIRRAKADDLIATDRLNIAEKRQHVLNLHRKYLNLAHAHSAS